MVEHGGLPMKAVNLKKPEYERDAKLDLAVARNGSFRDVLSYDPTTFGETSRAFF
jgi:hypothetical protein